jgi:hypothetical protein
MRRTKVFRTHIDARLRSDTGEQRVSRVGATPLNRVTLVPREPLPQHPPTVVRWQHGGFVLAVGAASWPMVVDGAALPAGPWRLSSGARFVAGSTPVEWVETTRRWEPDLSREKALLQAEDPRAWSVFADELMERGDPLGHALQPGAVELDVAFALEVAPLINQRRVTVTSGAHGWRLISFSFDLHAGPADEGLIAAVLTHPLAWFTTELELIVRPRRGPAHARRQVIDEARVLVAAYQSPHVTSVRVP